MLIDSIQRGPTGPSRVATPATRSNARANMTSGVSLFIEEIAE